MHRFSRLIVGMACSVYAANARADWVELTSSDLVQGHVVSLDAEKLKLQSPNFGEMTIPRDRVKLIGFGERPIALPAQSTPPAPLQLSSELPSLENKQFNQLLQEALGGGGIPELQQTINKTKDDLKSLKRDLNSGPEGDVVDSYIRILDLFGNLSPQTKSAKPRIAPKPAPQPNAEKPSQPAP